jgi:hypothetical protein
VLVNMYHKKQGVSFPDELLLVAFEMQCKFSYLISRSQWPSGLSNELSSSARTLGSWVPIPHEAWMTVCVYSVFVLFCV